MGQYDPVIPKAQLEHGRYYRGRCRNAEVARWHGERQIFYHWRTKFDSTFIEQIHCPEDDAQYDVFVAEALEDNPEQEIPFPEN